MTRTEKSWKKNRSRRHADRPGISHPPHCFLLSNPPLFNQSNQLRLCQLHSSAMNESEVEALAYAEFWDERYSKAGEEPTHEWFRSFDALEPFFKKHLFTKPHDARILHLGSGDSVSLDDRRLYRRSLLSQFPPIFNPAATPTNYASTFPPSSSTSCLPAPPSNGNVEMSETWTFLPLLLMSPLTRALSMP